MKTNKEVPKEVQEAWAISAISQNGGVGSKMFDRVNEIMEKYPIWFKAELKQKRAWAAVPAEVIDAYYCCVWIFLDFKFLQEHPDYNGEGHLNYLWNHPNVINVDKCMRQSENKTIQQMLEEMLEAEKRQKIKQQEEKDEQKYLWDLYFKPYKIEYNG